jgi:two-component system, NtrC family, sensor kinase
LIYNGGNPHDSGLLKHMQNPKNTWTEQFKDACRHSRATFTAWFNFSRGGWDLNFSFGLKKRGLAALERFLFEPQQNTWLSGALSSGRQRSCKTGIFSEELGCQRIYVYPNVQTASALIVGADFLDKPSEVLFKILAVNPPIDDPISHSQASSESRELTPSLFNLLETGLEVSYDPKRALAKVLEFLTASLTCDAALLSVRSGDIFRVKAAWKCPEMDSGIDISILDNPLLAEMVENRRVILINSAAEWGGDRSAFGFIPRLNQAAGSWLGFPIIIGQRIIGHLAFISSRHKAFTHDDLERIDENVHQLAYIIENAIIFTETSRYLEQFVLLNELASAASSSLDMDEVAHRVLTRISRTFKFAKASVFLLSPNGKMLREYGVIKSGSAPPYISIENSRIGRVIKTGIPYRDGAANNNKDSREKKHEFPDFQSELAVPLKYRGKVLGALSLLSQNSDDFSLEDEQLLVGIASHLASLFENIRLNEETRQRAYNLSLIHQVVSKLVGLNDLEEIARVAADLMVKQFLYERVTVILFGEEGKVIEVDAFADPEFQTAAEKLESQGKYGLSELVLQDGSSRIVDDVTLEPFYHPLPGWQAGSEMCVSLHEGDRVIGVIDVEGTRKHAFQENDLMALEALAGVMSSVVLSALRYRQLQDSVRQLEAVRETALDIAADLELDTLLRRVVHRARELVGAEGAELGLLDEKNQIVKVVVSETPWANTIGREIDLMAGVAGRVAAFGEPLVVPDYNTWKGRLLPERSAPFKSVAGVPLKFQGKVIGTLTVIDSRPDWEFKNEDVQLLELFAPQVTVFIRNARLYQELQERILAQQTAENRLIRSARLAAVGEMAAGVAHELNNPLTTVAGFVELVLDELSSDSPHKADLELVLKESLRARGVVRRLLDFSRPVENRRIRSDLNELVRDVFVLVHHLARTGGVEIRLELEEKLPWVAVDPAQIKQVLLNLIHNGIYAMPSGGLLHIRTGVKFARAEYEKKKFAVINVIDMGEGISEQNLERIFEPFFTTRPAGKGTGLGLSVSYGIINEHGGFIEVDSHLGQGSCFSIHLPLDADETYG